MIYKLLLICILKELDIKSTIVKIMLEHSVDVEDKKRMYERNFQNWIRDIVSLNNLKWIFMRDRLSKLFNYKI